jgi:hypothetical protein
MHTVPMSQTPYQRKLSLAAYDARIRERSVVAEALNKMILSVAKGRYSELPALHRTLPPTYRTMVGPPPRFRSDDR